MVLVSQIWMNHTMEGAIECARQRFLAVPRHIFIYMDDIWCIIKTPPTPRRPGLRSSNLPLSNPAEDFRGCLNAIHPRVQFTMEEEENHSIAFLDVFITRHDDGTLTTKIFRKPSNTNIGLKPQSCQDPKVVAATFKGELCRCHRLCTSLEQTKKEIDFTLNLFEDNGHNRAQLQKIADAYTPQPTAKSKNKAKDNLSNVNPEISIQQSNKELFRALPFRSEEDVAEEEEEKDGERKKFACIPYIPEIAHPLKRILKKAGVSTIFKSGTKLQNILCGANKTRPDPNKKKGVYRYQCPCSDQAVYVGQTVRACDLRWKEHGNAIRKENWSHSGISQHHQNCTHDFDPQNASVITSMQSKSKKKLGYDLKIREALEIRRNKCGPGKGLNEDMGAYVKTDIWDPVLYTIECH